jgi:hypothetical protein
LQKEEGLMTKTFVCALHLPLILFLACAQAEAAAVPANSCIGYENPNFKGKSFTFKAPKTGTKTFNLSGDMLKPDNTGNISSLRCAASCVMDVWEKLDQAGVAAEFSGEARSLGKDWNGRIRSAEIGCGIQDELADGRNDNIRDLTCTQKSGVLALEHARLQFFLLGNWHMFSGRNFQPEKLEIAQFETSGEQYRSANASEGDPVTTLTIRHGDGDQTVADLSVEGPNVARREWRCTVKHSTLNQGN